MKSLRAIVNRAGTRLAACMLLLPLAVAVEAGETVSDYVETKLTAADGAEGDLLGFSVAISGDTAVIGAPYEDDLGFSSGSAYVFARDPLDPTNWNQTAKLTAADGAESDNFGWSVAVSRDTAVIGAPMTTTSAAALARPTFSSVTRSIPRTGIRPPSSPPLTETALTNSATPLRSPGTRC